MRSHGWGGHPPADDEEARRRILTATRDRLAAAGTTNTSEIAEVLGVTRQTVYRYFPTTEELLNAAALDAVADLQDQIVAHVRKHIADGSADAPDAVVEAVAYVYEHLRGDPALSRLLAPGRMSTTIAALTAPSSIAIGGKLLAGFGIDWSAIGLAEDEQLELVEHLLRTLQSFVLDPGEPARTDAELRAYLRRWVAPALRARSG
jgi:AcrR family transcriptional regulator